MGGASIRVSAFSSGDESVKFHKGVGTEGGGKQLLRGIGGAEFGGEVGKVGEGQFPRITTFSNANVDDILEDEVAMVPIVSCQP